jgi:hypothetical protein
MKGRHPGILLLGWHNPALIVHIDHRASSPATPTVPFRHAVVDPDSDPPIVVSKSLPDK